MRTARLTAQSGVWHFLLIHKTDTAWSATVWISLLLFCWWAGSRPGEASIWEGSMFTMACIKLLAPLLRSPGRQLIGASCDAIFVWWIHLSSKNWRGEVEQLINMRMVNSLSQADFMPVACSYPPSLLCLWGVGVVQISLEPQSFHSIFWQITIDTFQPYLHVVYKEAIHQTHIPYWVSHCQLQRLCYRVSFP